MFFIEYFQKCFPMFSTKLAKFVWMSQKAISILIIFILSSCFITAQETNNMLISYYAGVGHDVLISKKIKYSGRGTPTQEVNRKGTNGNHLHIGAQITAPLSENFVLSVDVNVGLTKNNFQYKYSLSNGMGYYASNNYNYSDFLAYEQISVLPTLKFGKNVSPYFAMGPFVGFSQVIFTKGEQKIHSTTYGNPNTIIVDTTYKDNDIKTKYNFELGINTCLGIKFNVRKNTFFVEGRMAKSFSRYAEQPNVAGYHYSINIGICRELKT